MSFSSPSAPWMGGFFTPDPKAIAERGNVVNVSKYLGSGTFSGADIKVLVHYDDIKRENKRVSKEKEIHQAAITRKEKEKSFFLGLANTARRAGESYKESVHRKEVDRLTLDIEILSRMIAKIDEAIGAISKLPATKVLGELQTISYSVFREKSPVRTLGSVYPRSYVRGPRTIGGSMIFTVFHEHVLSEILNLNLGMTNTGAGDYDRNTYTTALPDQLPPLNISLVFANEYGAVSHMALYGLEFMQEGSTFSIQDIYSENVVQYVARDMDPMHIVSQKKIDDQGVTDQWSTTASNLSENILRRKGTRLRRNPFI